MNFKNIKEKYIKLSKSDDGKTLVSNFAYLTILKIIGYIFPLITIPYLARVIGVDGYGKIAFASSIIAYFQAFVDWGFNFTAVRDVARSKDDINVVSKIFSNVLTSKLLLMSVSIIVLFILIHTVPFMYSYRLVLWCTFLLIPGYILSPEWLFQALEHMKYITIMNLVSKTIFTILVFIVITDTSDYFYEPLLTSIGTFVSGLWALLYLRKKFGIKYMIPSLSDIRKTLRNSTNMFISIFLPNLYSNFSVILLNIYGGEIATGLYSAGNKLVSLCTQVSQIFSRIFFPFLSRKINKHKIYVKISGLINFIMFICLFVGADLLIDIFFTEDFEEAALIMRILSFSLIFLFLDNTFGTNYLIIKGHDSIVRNIVTCSSLFGFALSIFAVTRWSYLGAAITIVVVRGCMGVATWLYSRKY